MISQNGLLLNALQAATNIGSNQIVSVTKVFNDVVGSTAVDSFMDSAKGIGHRVVFGHSADYLPAIYEKFGISGLGDAFTHWLRDLSSPHGIPLPFANEIGNLLGMGMAQKTRWLCLNFGDVLSGGLSVAHSIHTLTVLKSAVSIGYLSPAAAGVIVLGAGIKIGTSLATGNILSLSSGFFDIGAVAWALSPALSMGSAYFIEPSLVAISINTYLGIGATSGLVSSTLLSFLLDFNRREKSPWYDRWIGAGIGGVSGALSFKFSFGVSGTILTASAFSSIYTVASRRIRSTPPELPEYEFWIESIAEFFDPLEN